VATYFLIGFLAGILAAPHCAGMCGPFPLHLARTTADGRPFLRQLLYVSGKTFTYAFLGAMAGLLGQWLMQTFFVGSHRYVLGFILGGGMLAVGLAMLGVIPVPHINTAPAGEQSSLARIYAQFLHSPGSLSSFILGVVTGFLPCGVTIAGLAVAVSTRSVLWGMLVMAGMGIGTAPVLLAIGISATLVNSRVRLIGMRTAGVLMLLVGVMTILRPTGILHNIMPNAQKAKAFIQSNAVSLPER
jgi:uncharacterized protein